eukprot:SAG31_NODE_2091_length_6465_cov_2.429626_9_plen_89_part_01
MCAVHSLSWQDAALQLNDAPPTLLCSAGRLGARTVRVARRLHAVMELHRALWRGKRVVTGSVGVALLFDGGERIREIHEPALVGRIFEL